MAIVFSLFIITLTSIAIYFAGEKFAEASSRLGNYLRLPPSVKAATFDAVSSSLPELLVALFSIIAFGKFEVGVGTIAGSAFFNLLIIPGLCVLVAPKVFKLHKEVIHRDGVVYIVAVVILLALLLITRSWGLLVALLLLLFYGVYLVIIIKDTKAFQKKHHEKTKAISLPKEISIALVTIAIIGVATFFLTQEAIRFAEAVGISPLIIGFTIIATATSLPDAVISIVNAKKGLADDAISNVFGSNTFNIFVGLGLPLLIGALLYGPTEIVFDRIEIIIALLITTLITYWFMDNDHIISKKEAIAMILMFVAFVSYIIILAFLGH